MKQLAKELANNPHAPIAWGILGIVIVIGAYAIWAAIKGKATHYLIAQIVLSSVSLIFMVFAIFMTAFESHSAYLKTADIPITRTGDDYYLVQYEDVEAVIWKKDLAHSEVAK